MTDTPAPNDMPSEALEIGQYVLKMMALIKAQGGTVKYLAIIPDEKVLALAEKFTPDEEREILKLWSEVKTISANLRAPVAAGGGALNWKRQKDTVFAWAAEHGFTPVESEIVDLLSALQQPPATAVDLEKLKRENPYHTRADKIKNQRQYDFISGWNDCIDHLAAQGMIKGVE